MQLYAGLKARTTCTSGYTNPGTALSSIPPAHSHVDQKSSQLLTSASLQVRPSFWCSRRAACNKCGIWITLPLPAA